MNETGPIFDGLNERQQEAVRATEGPVLILAGAGSGKTRALTHRIAHLIAQGVKPWQILAVTFTNKAANEMKERIQHMLHITGGEEASQVGLPVMGTFHSICVRILRRDIEQLHRDRNFVIYDMSDQETLVKHILKDQDIDPKQTKPRTVLSHISKYKSEAMSVEEARSEGTTEHTQRMAQLYAEYQRRLRESNALDFDDLILETVRLFQEVPDVLNKYQEMWRYINVDEYQDTNHAQYLLINLLAQKYRNLCVIGDPDQSIYAFRGADIRNILEFQEDYPDALSIKLEQNYRSTQQILDGADGVIEHNPNRPEKKMWTERKDGQRILLQEVRDEKREAEEAIKAVLDVGKEIALNEQVVLYRTNAQSRLFEEACMKNGVPYRLIGGTKFYARAEVKDVLAYLYALHNPQDTLSLLRIINVPSRKIGKTTLQRIQEHCNNHGMQLWEALLRIQGVEGLNGPVRERITVFTQLIEKYRAKKDQMVVSQLATELLDDIQMEEWVKDDTSEGEARWENIGELITVMHKYDQLDPEQSFVSFLEEVALISEVDAMTNAKEDALTLMTLHLCKGLEFSHVIVAGCEEGIFPHAQAQFDREQLEEERRLMYVGMTRAKDSLRLLTARSRMLWGDVQANEPSRFLDDIPEHLAERKSDELMSQFGWSRGSCPNTSTAGGTMDFDALYQNASTQFERLSKPKRTKDVDLEFNQDFGFDEENQDTMDVFDHESMQQGARIKHPVFGEGVVMSKRGDIVDVQFDSGAKKTFALSIAPLEVVVTMISWEL